MAHDKKPLSLENVAKEFWDSFSVPKYDEESERLAEEKALASIESLLNDIPTGGLAGLAGDLERKRLEFEKNLIGFAREQRISLRNKNWRTTTLELAAMEHSKLKPGRRKRGRPPKYEGGIDDVYVAVEKIRSLVTNEHGEKPNVANTCRFILQRLDEVNGRPHNPNSEGVEAQVNNYRNRHSKQKGLLKRKASRKNR